MIGVAATVSENKIPFTIVVTTAACENEIASLKQMQHNRSSYIKEIKLKLVLELHN